MPDQIFRFLKSYGIAILIGLLALVFVALRLLTYGDLRLSIGTSDTPSYLEAAETWPFSADVFTRQRLLTINLLYWMAQPPDGFELRVVNSPAAEVQNPYRLVQPGFEPVVLLQTLFSIIGWLTLTLVIIRHVHHPVVKVTSALTLLVFAFTPQIADWDSILTSESLSLSLFALSFALLIEFVFWSLQPAEKRSPTKGWILVTLALPVFFLFVFTRDANLYVVSVTIGLLLPFLYWIVRNRNFPLLAAGGLLIVFFVLGTVTARQSGRWKLPLSRVYAERILPYPLRVEFMQSRGMPDPAGPAYESWFNEHAPAEYARFLFFHPGYTFLTLFENLDMFFSENVQPYFIDPAVSLRVLYLDLGNLLHPLSSAVVLIDLLLLVFLWLLYLQWRARWHFAWAWLGTWLFLSAFATLLIGYHSDSIGIVRHVLAAVVYSRLFLWLFLLVVLDQALIPKTATTPAEPLKSASTS